MFNALRVYCILFLFASLLLYSQSEFNLKLNEKEYYEIPGLNVMVFDDFYPEGHQGGVSIIQFGNRILANGDLRLEAIAGQWSPVPKVNNRTVDKENETISVQLEFPDPQKNNAGFNPINYPDLELKYTIRTFPVGQSIKVIVDLDKPLPEEWAGKVGFNIEIFPGAYFGEHFLMDSETGIFPRQANGPVYKDDEGNVHSTPLASGKTFVAAPGDSFKEIKIESMGNNLDLYDGRDFHNNGWYVLHSSISAGVTENAVEWIISPTINTGWRYEPVVQVSQVGYHPDQLKMAVIELDNLTENLQPVKLIKIENDKEIIVKETASPVLWGSFLRYKYVQFDFSEIKAPGIYKVIYGSSSSNEFQIKEDIFTQSVWQPTIEYFLPVQMCHMRINDRYKVWHGLCHMDDARMAPLNHTHFDGYKQGSSTLTKYEPGEHIDGLNIGGWHDAGDYDLRVESQAGTVYKLCLAYELFGDNLDQTSIDQKTRIVEIHIPDGKPDILQQVEHGVLTIVGGYEALGRLYRGIICPELRQYVLLGDGAAMTDNLVYRENGIDSVLKHKLPPDDRWVFTEENPGRELYVAGALAFAGKTLQSYNPELAQKCLSISKEIYEKSPAELKHKLPVAAELFLATSDKVYEDLLMENAELIKSNFGNYFLSIGRVTAKMNNPEFTQTIRESVQQYLSQVEEQEKDNPYGVPYRPYIWGAGWGIQEAGVRHLMLHIGFPDIFPSEYAFNALNFVLGCHPGINTSSFVSGVGVNSLTVAYGVNRDEWSYIPGGVGSGTALIRPDFPELKVWPYFWQQTEYVVGGGATDFMILAMAADHLFNNPTK